MDNAVDRHIDILFLYLACILALMDGGRMDGANRLKDCVLEQCLVAHRSARLLSSPNRLIPLFLTDDERMHRGGDDSTL